LLRFLIDAPFRKIRTNNLIPPETRNPTWNFYREDPAPRKQTNY